MYVLRVRQGSHFYCGAMYRKGDTFEADSDLSEQDPLRFECVSSPCVMDSDAIDEPTKAPVDLPLATSVSKLGSTWIVVDQYGNPMNEDTYKTKAAAMLILESMQEDSDA